MDSCCSIVKSNEIAVVDDTAASASIHGIAVKANGSNVADGFAAEADGTAVVDDIAAEANVAGVVHVATEASGTAVPNDATAEAYGIQSHNHPVQPQILPKSFLVRTLKLWKLLCLSGITSLVNNSNVDIDFYATAEQLRMSYLRFRLKALHTKCIDMRGLFAFWPARPAEGVRLMVEGKFVKLKVEGKFESLSFIPQDFVTYKKFMFSQENEGELICHREVRW